jgi:hypothetical protein
MIKVRALEVEFLNRAPISPSQYWRGPLISRFDPVLLRAGAKPARSTRNGLFYEVT